jgi:hypothetical protein
MKMPSLIIAACLVASSSYADIHVQFLEGAPKDRFVVTNEGACQIEAIQVTIDLSGSGAGLIFDVSESGSGVEVFQPFEVSAGAEHLSNQPEIADGDQLVTLNIKDFGPSKSVAFTIDVDDTLGGREITVSDSEIQGVKVSAMLGKQNFSGVLDDNSEVKLSVGDCQA